MLAELRWLLEPGHPSNHPDARWTLQYRIRMPLMIDRSNEGTKMKLAEWSNWIDVPYVSEDK
jgi:hypothetical protein